jgi:hypothetical protein
MLHWSLLKVIRSELSICAAPFLLFPRAVFETSVIGLTFLLVAQLSRCLLSNCSLLMATHPERFHHRVPVGPGLSPSTSSGWCGQKFREWSTLLHLRLLLCVKSILSFLRGPTLPQCPDIHFRSLTEVLAARFMASNSRVCVRPQIMFSRLPHVAPGSCFVF